MVSPFRFPSAKEFASLMVFVTIIGQIKPNTSPAPGNQIWQESSSFMIDRGVTLKLVEDVLDSLLACDTYQKRRILREIIASCDRAQKVFAWGVRLFHPQQNDRGKDKTELNLQDFDRLLKRKGERLHLEAQDDPDIGDRDLFDSVVPQFPPGALSEQEAMDISD